MKTEAFIRPEKKGVFRRLGFPLLILASLATAVLGTYGFSLCLDDAGRPYSLGDAVYQSIRLFTLESGLASAPVPWPIQLARFLAPALTLTAIVQTLAEVFRAEVRAFRLARSKGHTVICGAGTKASALLSDCRRLRRRVVVIDTVADGTGASLREEPELFAICGDAADAEILKLARAEQAERVFVTTGNDSVNIEIVAALVRLVRASKNGGRIICYVHLVNRQTAELFKQHRIFKDAADRVDVRAFNVYDNAAHLLWQDHLSDVVPPAPAEARRLHVVIGGLGQMGEAVLLQVVRSARSANGRPPAVTVVDHAAAVCQERLLERYPALSRLCDLAFVEADLARAATLRHIADTLAKSDEIGVVIFCRDDDHTNFTHALQLVPHLASDETRIYIRLSRAAGLCELLRAEHSASALAKRIDGFGLAAVCCSEACVSADPFSREGAAEFSLLPRESPDGGLGEPNPMRTKD